MFDHKCVFFLHYCLTIIIFIECEAQSYLFIIILLKISVADSFENSLSFKLKDSLK